MMAVETDTKSGGGFFTKKVAGIPAWGIGAGVAVLAYLYFKHKQSSTTTSGVPTGYAPAATIINTGEPSGSLDRRFRHYRPPTGVGQQPPAKRAPGGGGAPAPTPLAPPTTVNSNNYPMTLANGQGLEILGKMVNGTGEFAGDNVSSGAPVYAYTNGSWQQGFNAKTLPAGTPLATLNTFASDVGNYTSGEQLH